METIRVAWGSSTGPTATASFDAALADAGVHNYNLVTLSSVVPPDATLAVVGTVPDLGPTGEALYCVRSRRTAAPGTADDAACAGIGWARDERGRGLFYEASGVAGDDVRDRIERGLTHGMAIRDWTVAETDAVVETIPAKADEHATAVALAAYGESESLLDR